MEATFQQPRYWCSDHKGSVNLGIDGQSEFVPMYSKYTAHISSNGSHFLMARVLVYWTNKVSKFEYRWTKWTVTMYSK